MQYGSLIVLILVLSPLFTKGEEWQPAVPVIREFSGQKYKESRWDPTFRGYTLGEVCLMPSREWIVFAVNGNVRRPDRSEIVAVGAYHVSSGLMREFVFSLRPGGSPWAMEIVGSLRRDFVPMGGNRVGIVTVHLPLDRKDAEPSRHTCPATGPVSLTNPETGGTSAARHAKYLLWEWDLDRDSARFVGPWDYAMTPITQVLQLGQCNVCWTSHEKATNGELRLLDLASSKRTTITLDPKIHVAETTMQTYAPTASPCAFAVCDPLSPHDVQVYCVDPNAPNGIRWRWDKAALQDAVGPNIEEAGFLQNLSYPCQKLPLLIYSLAGKKYSVYLVFLDEKTGKITGRTKIASNVSSMMLPMISSDNRRLVVELGSLGNEREYKDSSEDGLCTRLRIIDLDSGKYRDTANLFDIMQLCWLRGFLDDEHVLLSDEDAVWMLETGTLRVKELFRKSGDTIYWGRVAPGDCSPGAPTDPDVQDYRIRFLK